MAEGGRHLQRRYPRIILITLTLLWYLVLILLWINRPYLASNTVALAATTGGKVLIGLLVLILPGVPGAASLYLWRDATTLWPQLLWGALVTVSFWLILSLAVLFAVFGPNWLAVI